MNRGLLVALESFKNCPNQEPDKINKAIELEARIRDQDFIQNSYFEFKAARKIEITKVTDSLRRSCYNITFEGIYGNIVAENIRIPEFSFSNYLVFEDKQPAGYLKPVNFSLIGLYRKTIIEEANSLLDKYFEIQRPETTISKPDTTKESCRKGTLIVLVALFLGLVITIFSLRYYYRKKVKKFSNRVYKKRQERKNLKLCK